MNTSSAFAPRALLALIATGMLAVLCALLPKTAHAQTGTPERYGPIVRFTAVVAQASTSLPTPPADIEQAGPSAPNVLRAVYVLMGKDEKSNSIILDDVMLECFTTGRAACNHAAAALREAGYVLATNRPTTASLTCIVSGNWSVSCGRGSEAFAAQLRKNMEAISSRAAAASKK